MNEYSISDYGIFTDAVTSTNDCSNKVTLAKDGVNECKTVIGSESVFMGPIADKCSEALTGLDTDCTTIISNLGSMSSYLISTSGTYQNADQEANATITGGDTDSLKIRCDEDVTNEMLLDALKPLHIAIRNAIDVTMQRVRKLYPNLASNLNGIGEFECEKCAGFDRWKYHLEAWNKARISINNIGKVHITCAGLSRPLDAYTVEDFTEDLLKEGYSPFELLPVILGYNVFVTHELSFALEHKRPYCNDVFEGMVTDYLGNEYEVCQTEAIALYDSGRCLGDSLKQTNAENIQYLRNIQHMEVDDSEKWLQLRNDKPEIIIGGKVKYHVS